MLPYLDVLLLGRAQAINLGVNYTQMTRMLLILVALMVAIATALVGPITFLGLLTINLAHELIKISNIVIFYQQQFVSVGSVYLSHSGL